jgi:hypothetical protein
MEDSGIIRVDLEMHPIGRNEGPMVVVVDESSKSPLFEGGGQSVDGTKQVESKEVANEEKCERPTNDDIIVEGFGKERPPLEEWWKNHILPQHGEKWANVAKFENIVHMQPQSYATMHHSPQNPRNTQRYASNPHYPPKHLETQPNTQMVLIPTPTQKSKHINSTHPQPKYPSRKPKTNLKPHNQHFGTLQHM